MSKDMVDMEKESKLKNEKQKFEEELKYMSD